MTYSLKELAKLSGSSVIGDPETIISGVCSIENTRKGCIALTPGIVDFSKVNEAPSALIANQPYENSEIPILVNSNPRLAWTTILNVFNRVNGRESGIHDKAIVDESAVVGESTYIGPYAVIEGGAKIGKNSNIGAGTFIGKDTVIGDDALIYPNVTILHGVSIGKRCIIHSGVVIGSDGFGFTPDNGVNVKVPQVGRVVIGDDFEIGANSTIDRATLDETVIGDDVKIDNLVQIAHNVKIGPHTRIAAQAGLSGRVEIEANVVIGGQAGFQNGIKVGEGSMIGGQAGVTRNVAAGSRVSGYPARDHKQALQLLAAQNRLPELIEKIEEIEKAIKKLSE